MSAEAKLKELGIELPTPPKAVANYVPFVRQGDLVFVAGQAPFGPDGKVMFTGKLGAEVSQDDGYRSARQCALNCLAQVRAALGSLDKVARVVSLRGFVASTADFYNQAQVMNGASDLMVEVFGDAGRHARAALGTNVLPLNMTTEVELVVAVKD